MHLFRPGTALHLSTRFPQHDRSPSGSEGDRASGFSVLRDVVIVIAMAMLLSGGVQAQADEPITEFIEGLRQRRYFDTALEYIEQLEKRTDIPAEIRDTISLERGITYRAMGTVSRIPEDREQALGQAELALKEFTSRHGNHPRAAYANFELGQLLLERARSLTWDAESPSNADRKGELQQQARALIDQAKAIYQKAHDQYDAKHKSYPTFIDKAEKPDLYAERLQVFTKYLSAWFNLARCTYERGQTFDMGTKERNETLVRASTQFEAIHSANRSTPIGRHSRLMMGKCFQEQGDIRRALGIYNEITNDKSDLPVMMMLKSYAVQFRLICLNHEDRASYQVVINEATEWLENKLNRERLYSEQGLGILWEKAIAEEKLSQNREIEAKQRTAILRQALADAKQVARFPSPYREPAVAMGRRINMELGEKDEEPKDFDTAFERGRGMITQLKGLQDDLKAAKTADEKQKAQQAIDSQLNEVGRLFQLALDLRDVNSDPKAVAQARYLLSYVFLRQRKSFDALILARYCMTRDKTNDPDSALSATEIAINAAIQAYNDAGDKQAFELGLLKEICELIITEYSHSSKGNEARFRLGQVYRDLDDPLSAAKTYLTVPEDYSEYASARIQAGQSYWLAWVKVMAAAEDGGEPSESAETLTKWKSDATNLLTEGLTASRAKIGADGKPTTEMVAGEVSLATILNMDGKFAETVKRLTDGGDNSVLKQIEVADPSKRPAKGITSAGFASQTYRLMLRAYIGTQQVENALTTMDKLESVGGQDMAAVYTELGRELQEELRRLQLSGETEKLNETRQQFEAFLEKVYEGRDSSDYNSLLWIGETYFGLGKGVKDDPVAAPAYFQKASQAYDEILSNKLVEGPTVAAIQLRIIRCKRAQGLYEEGVALAQQVLTANPLSLDVQFEAAYTLADWGADEGKGQPEKLLTSIEGIKNAEDKLIVWGWKGITTRLQARQDTPDWKELKDRFLEAKYAYVESRVRYARTGAPEGEKHLRSALAEVHILAQVFHDIDETWFGKFARLYEDIQGELNIPEAEVKVLERPEPIEIPAEELVAKNENDSQGGTEDGKTEEEGGAEAAEPEGANLILIAIAVALAAAGGFAFYKVMSKPPQRRKSLGPDADSIAPPPMAGGGGFGDTDGAPDFSNLGNIPTPASTAVAAAPPKKRVRRNESTGGAAPGKKRRRATPEEAARIKAARAAKAAGESGSGMAASPKRKKLLKKKKQAQPGSPSAEGGDTARSNNPEKKKSRKRPPADS